MLVTYFKSNIAARELMVTGKATGFSEVAKDYDSVPRVGDTVRFRYKEELMEMEVKKVIWQLPCKLTDYETFHGNGEIHPKLRKRVYVYGE